MKFDQLVKYNMRSIFPEKSCTKRYRPESSRPFFKKSKLSIFLDQQSEVQHSSFLLYVQVEDCQKILKLRCQPLAFTSYKASFV